METTKIEIVAVDRYLVGVKDCAKILGISPKTLQNWISEDNRRNGNPKKCPVKPKRIGSRVLFDIKDINEYLDTLD